MTPLSLLPLRRSCTATAPPGRSRGATAGRTSCGSSCSTTRTSCACRRRAWGGLRLAPLSENKSQKCQHGGGGLIALRPSLSRPLSPRPPAPRFNRTTTRTSSCLRSKSTGTPLCTRRRRLRCETGRPARTVAVADSSPTAAAAPRWGALRRRTPLPRSPASASRDPDRTPPPPQESTRALTSPHHLARPSHPTCLVAPPLSLSTPDRCTSATPTPSTAAPSSSRRTASTSSRNTRRAGKASSPHNCHR